jgi:hypothetical protein
LERGRIDERGWTKEEEEEEEEEEDGFIISLLDTIDDDL